MRRIRPGRLMVTVLVLGFAVFFGLDLATKGMERVQGPVEEVGRPAVVAHQPEGKTAAAGGNTVRSTAPSGTKVSSAQTGAASGQAQTGKAASKATVKDTPPQVTVKESFLNHLSNRIGDALHQLAKGIIGAVVSIFDAFVS